MKEVIKEGRKDSKERQMRGFDVPGFLTFRSTVVQRPAWKRKQTATTVNCPRRCSSPE